MTREQEPIKIDVEDVSEEEPIKADDGTNISDELRNLGKQFADTVQDFWNSEERQRIEAEFKEGVQNFATELNKVFADVKDSQAGQKVREEAARIDSSDVANKAKTSIAQGLQWLSTELAKLSESMQAAEGDVEAEAEAEPAEKSPEDLV